MGKRPVHAGGGVFAGAQEPGYEAVKPCRTPVRAAERERKPSLPGGWPVVPRLLRKVSPTPTPAADALAVPRAPCSTQVCGGLSGPPDVLIHPWAGARAAGARGFESSRGIPVFSVGRCGLARDTPSIFRLLRSFLSSIGKGPPPRPAWGGPTPSHVSHRGAGATPSSALGAGAAVLHAEHLRPAPRGFAGAGAWATCSTSSVADGGRGLAGGLPRLVPVACRTLRCEAGSKETDPAASSPGANSAEQ